MNPFIRNITQKVVKNNFAWRALYSIIRTSNFLQYHRSVVCKEAVIQQLNNEFIRLLKKPVVKNGPFEGLKYPGFQSYGSALFPKILGSYEQELHRVLEIICSKNYSVVLDIGSAEGYYAVGLALRFPSTPIYAYDINEEANAACARMAELNVVSDKVIIKSACTTETLADFPFEGRGLIICDCEGYEKTLFNHHNLGNLRNCDLLIETHDFLDIETSDYLKQLFCNTHKIHSVYSTDDIAKARTYVYPELEGMSLHQKKEILKEGRPAIMEWLYLEPKQ